MTITLGIPGVSENHTSHTPWALLGALRGFLGPHIGTARGRGCARAEVYVRAEERDLCILVCQSVSQSACVSMCLCVCVSVCLCVCVSDF